MIDPIQTNPQAIEPTTYYVTKIAHPEDKLRVKFNDEEAVEMDVYINKARRGDMIWSTRPIDDIVRELEVIQNDPLLDADVDIISQAKYLIANRSGFGARALYYNDIRPERTDMVDFYADFVPKGHVMVCVGSVSDTGDMNPLVFPFMIRDDGQILITSNYRDKAILVKLA